MAVDLELSPGEFLVPVLIRAVRAVGVQCGLDLDRLADAGIAVEAVARAWAGDGDPPDVLLRVRIGGDDGAMQVAFSFSGTEDADRVRRAALVPRADRAAALDALAAAAVLDGDAGASRLVMCFRP